MSLERVTRPYSAASKRYGKLFVVRTIEGTEDSGVESVLFWKSTTELKVVDASPKTGSTSSPKKGCNNTEVDRTTHDLRVENPDDPAQYVDVEIIDTVTFSTKKQRENDLVNRERVHDAEVKVGLARADDFEAFSIALEKKSIADHEAFLKGECAKDAYKLNNPL